MNKEDSEQNEVDGMKKGALELSSGPTSAPKSMSPTSVRLASISSLTSTYSADAHRGVCGDTCQSSKPL